MQDFERRDIKVGDVIVYAVKHGTSVALVRATVLALVERTSPWNGRVRTSIKVQPFNRVKPVTLSNPTCVVTS